MSNEIAVALIALFGTLAGSAGGVLASSRLTNFRGQVYKGASFWDTEMFMLPFFDFTDPEVARRLVQYRIHTLPADFFWYFYFYIASLLLGLQPQ